MKKNYILTDLLGEKEQEGLRKFAALFSKYEVSNLTPQNFGEPGLWFRSPASAAVATKYVVSGSFRHQG